MKISEWRSPRLRIKFDREEIESWTAGDLEAAAEFTVQRMIFKIGKAHTGHVISFASR
ncbi:MAG: hypothetical protein ACI9R3_005219 [Verrucomicrobiales bacterium]|jgi:hypothetical protein